MKSLRNIRTFALAALAMTLYSGQAQAQVTPTVDAQKQQLEMQLRRANVVLVQSDELLADAEADIAKAWDDLQRIEEEIDSPHTPRTNHREQLLALAKAVELVERDVETMTGRLPAVQFAIEEVASMAMRLGFHDIYRQANVMASLTDELFADARSYLINSSDLKAEIDRVASKLSRS